MKWIKKIGGLYLDKMTNRDKEMAKEQWIINMSDIHGEEEAKYMWSNLSNPEKCRIYRDAEDFI